MLNSHKGRKWVQGLNICDKNISIFLGDKVSKNARKKSFEGKSPIIFKGYLQERNIQKSSKGRGISQCFVKILHQTEIPFKTLYCYIAVENFEWIIKQYYWLLFSYDIKNYRDLGGFCLPQYLASADNTLLDVDNFSYHTQPQPIIANICEKYKLINWKHWPWKKV